MLIPDGFSPNNDNLNDQFKVEFNCTSGELNFEEKYPEARVEIFSRWRILIFEKDYFGNETHWGVNNAWWDGSSNHNGQLGGDKLPVVIYFYILYLGNGARPVTGSIFLNN